MGFAMAFISSFFIMFIVGYFIGTKFLKLDPTFVSFI